MMGIGTQAAAVLPLAIVEFRGIRGVRIASRFVAVGTAVGPVGIVDAVRVVWVARPVWVVDATRVVRAVLRRSCRRNKKQNDGKFLHA